MLFIVFFKENYLFYFLFYYFSLNLYNDKIALVPEQLQAVRNIAEGPRNDATYIIFGPPGKQSWQFIVDFYIVTLYLYIHTNLFFHSFD